MDYLKSKGISKENYTRMVISAQCNLDQATQEYFHAKDIIKKQGEDFIRYLITHRDTTKGTESNNLSLIQDLKSNSIYKQWTTDRFLSNILKCYLQDDYLERMSSLLTSRIEPHIPRGESLISLIESYDMSRSVGRRWFGGRVMALSLQAIIRPSYILSFKKER
ncbi:hypothetical protein RF11_15891 [Thelohanellus kitauei]|uniref:Uncharacterized protein n=1 Tax=Thelohanellus kitauei TaxID=669202 RepID=A0A0C2ITE7_THEKT|nr:hypothetical protein RF11_15891 [Thelohanellus kitauei]